MNKRSIKFLKLLFAGFLVINVTGPLLMPFNGNLILDNDWTTADRGSSGIAPLPEDTPEAVVQVYAARALNWRGIFAVHTWIATKEKNAGTYTVHHVLGWNERRGLPVVVSATDVPDRAWYGYPPEIVSELRGAEAETAIVKIADAVSRYPYKHDYVLWPGPNSNTFIAHIGRHVPELKLNLPPNAIGKDYLLNSSFIDKTPSGTGVQFSMYGLFGLLVSKAEGVEINFLGLVSGVNPFEPAIKLPGTGKIAFN
jgi:hypothetical protein